MNIIALLETYALVDQILNEEIDVEKFLQRARGVQSLIDRGAYEGEKEAARMAMRRLSDRVAALRFEMFDTEWTDLERRFKAIQKSQSQSNNDAAREWARRAEAERRAREERERPRQDQYQDTGIYPKFEDLTLYKYARFQADGSDKVYGVAVIKSTVITFWGRTGGTLRSKIHNSLAEAKEIFQSKVNKGYQPLTPDLTMARYVSRNVSL